MRSRNIKPGFFTCPELIACDYPARILFSGLWCCADREGRLEDRPAKLRLELFPGDPDLDVDQLLHQLESGGLIERYQAQGLRVIRVCKFAQHQNPHHRERASDLPPPPDAGMPPDLTAPPSSESLPPIEVVEEVYQVGGVPSDAHPVQQPLPAIGVVLTKPKPQIPKDEIVRAWMDICAPAGAGDFEGWSPARVKKLRQRCMDDPSRFDVRWWRDLFERVAVSPFLCGKGASGWRATLSWLLERENLLRVLEGQYDPRTGDEDGVPAAQLAAVERELRYVDAAIRGAPSRSQDPVTAAVINDMGGYKRLGAQPPRELPRHLATFRRAYLARIRYQLQGVAS